MTASNTEHVCIILPGMAWQGSVREVAIVFSLPCLQTPDSVREQHSCSYCCWSYHDGCYCDGNTDYMCLHPIPSCSNTI